MVCAGPTLTQSPGPVLLLYVFHVGTHCGQRKGVLVKREKMLVRFLSSLSYWFSLLLLFVFFILWLRWSLGHMPRDTKDLVRVDLLGVPLCGA